jgi:hypothetical protein
MVVKGRFSSKPGRGTVLFEWGILSGSPIETSGGDDDARLGKTVQVSVF